MNNKKYYVYMHVNKINNKKYIGITCQKKPEYRWGKNGSRYNNSVFYTAIEKYGWDNFDHIILHQDLSQEQAYKIEQELIAKYNTRDRQYGYNLSIGGEHGSTGYFNNNMSIPVYQYDLNGYYLSEYPSLSEAERKTGISNSFISGCCKGKHAYAGDFQWSYKKVDKMPSVDKFKIASDHRKDKGKGVYQYSLTGEYINYYSSIKDASLCTNSSQSGIYKCCNGNVKSTNNYQWFYEYQGEKVSEIIPYINLYHSKTAINVFDIDMNFIDTYESLQDALNSLEIFSASKSAIYECMQGKRKTAYGYIWRYA